jgi:putative ABC transport system ATP-binding protein
MVMAGILKKNPRDSFKNKLHIGASNCDKEKNSKKEVSGMDFKRSSDTQQEDILIEAIDIHKYYDTGKVTVKALQGVTLSIERKEIVAIMGPSGCGKTTLLNCLSGLDQVTKGTIKIANQNIRHLSDRQRTLFRAREMGFVFQSYNLLPVLTGLENVELPLLVGSVSAREARTRALASIERVGLLDWAYHRPAEMSGGQRQRFAIARALATTPSIVWADEPTGALDSTTSQEIIDLMLSLNQDLGLTFVWVTHSLDIARQASRMITMSDGLINDDVLLAAPGRMSAFERKGAE